jgi:hypothetical protein
MMNKPASVLDDLSEGTPLGPFACTVSAAANERYWRAAGISHPALEAGALYPPIAANLTILMFLETCPHPMIQTGQVLQCHRTVDAGTPLTVTGRVTARYEKRGHAYVDVKATVAATDMPADPIWTSTVSFTPAAELTR